MQTQHLAPNSLLAGGVGSLLQAGFGLCAGMLIIDFPTTPLFVGHLDAGARWGLSWLNRFSTAAVGTKQGPGQVSEPVSSRFCFRFFFGHPLPTCVPLSTLPQALSDLRLKIKQEGKPQVLVHVSTYQGSILGTGFLSHSHMNCLRLRQEPYRWRDW